MAQHGRPSVARGRGPRFRFQAGAALGVGGAHGTVWTGQTTQLVRRESALVRGVSRRAKGREIGVSLATPPKLRRLQEALYTKAKQEPAYRFYLLHDKMYRADILAHAYAIAKQNGGAPGVDGMTFEDIEAAGLEPWLAAVGEALRTERYRPQPVRRVLIPKPGGVGERPLGIPRIPHSELMKSLARRISDRKMLRLLKRWLKAPGAERTEGGGWRFSGGKRGRAGRLKAG
jgi:hypothetical protein